ncbi:MAG: acetylglutamate kinase [Candidatus Omnitrophica bacterium]|nr:acetylglutamate kinase [Candidatus Omnitrophota bacterium]
MEDLIKKAQILVEAFPYIEKFKGKIIVIKYGGRALLSEQAKGNILEDIAFMSLVGIKPVIVHGGGHKITESIAQDGGVSKFVDGKRVTDKKTMQVVYKVLKDMNKDLVQELISFRGRAESVDPKICKNVRVKQESKKLGYVGVIERIKPDGIVKMTDSGFVPVIMPVGLDSKGSLYNINADDMASEVAISLKADKLVLLTDVKGILREKSDEDSLISSLHVAEVDELIKIGVISSGMIPKVKACLNALNRGVKKTHILDGRVPHVILLEVFTTAGVGTEMVQ